MGNKAYSFVHRSTHICIHSRSFIICLHGKNYYYYNLKRTHIKYGIFYKQFKLKGLQHVYKHLFVWHQFRKYSQRFLEIVFVSFCVTEWIEQMTHTAENVLWTYWAPLPSHPRILHSNTHSPSYSHLIAHTLIDPRVDFGCSFGPTTKCISN